MKSREKQPLPYQDYCGIHQWMTSAKYNATESLTKRKIYSNIAAIYNPPQQLTAMTIGMKILMPKICQSEVGWDDCPSEDILTDSRWYEAFHAFHGWNLFGQRAGLYYSQKFWCELHCFCDASEAVYAAVVYSNIEDSHGMVSISLICAKTRVKPLKRKITLSRLNLIGAMLLASRVISAMDLKEVAVNCWYDSAIVLDWIKTKPRKVRQCCQQGGGTQKLLEGIPGVRATSGQRKTQHKELSETKALTVW